MNNNLLEQIALTLIPQIGAVHARILIDHFGNAADIFKAKKDTLDRIEGIGDVRASSIKAFTDFNRAEEEIAFIEKYKITPLFITDANYPKRLLKCYDPPTLLYYRGNTNVNAEKIIAIIGTRSNTDYGKHFTETLVTELQNSNILVVSGLAYGIDAIAHKAAVKNNLPTIAVLAHGLDNIYPTQHTQLAKEMVKNGGLLTEFTSNTKPDRHNFPTRNRIVAGMSDATLVIETGPKGGSIITAELAIGYNKDVFALPGRTTDSKSTGCNELIKNNKAVLLTDTQSLIEKMGWQQKKPKQIKQQRELFIQLSPEEKIIVNILKEKETVAIDELNLQSHLSSSAVAAVTLNLELQGVIASLPGKMYKLL